MFHINSLIFAEERMDRNLNVCLSDSQGRLFIIEAQQFLRTQIVSFDSSALLHTILLHIRIL